MTGVPVQRGNLDTVTDICHMNMKVDSRGSCQLREVTDLQQTTRGSKRGLEGRNQPCYILILKFWHLDLETTDV